MTRYDYHTGLRSYEAAQRALFDATADCEISEAERPQIEAYTVTTSCGCRQTRYKITLQG